MSDRYILAIDQGTTGTTALLMREDLTVVAKHNCEFRQTFPQPSFVEHEADAIWQSVETSVQKVLEKPSVSAKKIAAIGITNQRETTGLFDKKGNLVHNFIVWQCKRTTSICEKIKQQGLESKIREKTGLVVDPYFSATKLMWLLQNIKGAKERAHQGDLLFGTVDTWLVYKLTQGTVHVTDGTNASRTMLMNLKTLTWDNELLEYFQIPFQCLPKICTSSEVYGVTKGLSFLPDGIPIAGIAGDQQAALFGQACFEKGEAKATYGTGCFILMNTGTEIVPSDLGLLTSVAIHLPGKVQYCLEGSAFIAGALVQWLRDGLEIINQSRDIEALAAKEEDSGDVVFVPALSGLGTPYWRPFARGLLCGISRDTTKAHIARAALEGIVLQNYDIISVMEKMSGKLSTLKVDGGAAQDDLMIQIQADVLGTPCVRPQVLETTAFGAACLAALGAGILPNQTAVKKSWKEQKTFFPAMKDVQKQKLLQKWKVAVEKA